LRGINLKLKISSYIVVLLSLSSAALLTFLIRLLIQETVFGFFIVAVAVSTWYGGTKPGLLAIFLSTLAINYFFNELGFVLYIRRANELGYLLFFILVAGVIAWLILMLRNTKKRLEASMDQLKKTESRFRRLAESNIIGVVIGELHGQIFEANDAFLNMVGYTREDLLTGKLSWGNITPPESLTMSDHSLADLKSHGVCQPSQKEYIRKDRSLVPVLAGFVSLEANTHHVIGFVLDISQRKQAERALWESQSRFRALADATIEGVVIHEHGRVLDTNPAFARMFGYGTAEVIGMSVTDFLTPESQFKFWENIYVGEEKPFEVTGLTKDGSTFFLEIVGKHCVYEGRSVQVKATRNITERKKAELALQNSERRFRRLVESNIFGVSFGRLDDSIHYANHYFLNMLGYTRKEITDGEISWRRITAPESRDLDVKATEELLKYGVTNPFEKIYIRKDGSCVAVLTGLVALEEPFDRDQEVILFTIDLSETKRAQKCLHEREEELRLITDTLPVLISLVDNQLRYRFSNKAYEEWFGIPTTQIYGMPIREILGESAYEAIYPHIEEILLSRGNAAFETQIPHQDGKSHFVKINFIPQFDQQGHISSYIILAVDITQQKQAEQEREQLLQREQAARAEAEAGNRLKDEFLATLSHELRTPLNAILGWTQLLRSRKFDETTTAKALETIDRNSRTLAQLIEDVLDVSRIIQGKLRLNTQPVELVLVVETAIDIIRPAADAKEIYLDCNLDPVVGVVMGDAHRLQQIVWNLLSNAVKFTPKGGRVKVELTRIDSRVQICVRDTGGGIDPKFLPHVFERFHQGDSSTSRSHSGLGLGLAIVRHLVELHGGTVTAQSVGIGKGATFTVNLPMKALAVISRQPSPTLEEPVVKYKLPILEGVRVLIVDDEADARHLLNTMLGQYGAQVMTVASTSEALSALPQFHPDVLVSDIGMPEEDGYALIRKLRAISPEQGGGIPAVALTAYARAEDRAQALLAGFQLHIPKPVNPVELAAVIANLAGRTGY